MNAGKFSPQATEKHGNIEQHLTVSYPCDVSSDVGKKKLQTFSKITIESRLI